MLSADATVATLRPDGSGIVTGHSSGALHQWPMPPSAASAAPSASTAAAPAVATAAAPDEAVGAKRGRVEPPATPDSLSKQVRSFPSVLGVSV